jgi:predicted nucleic acid-binding protein
LIYLDSSVVLARLFSEPESPSESFWAQRFTSSRLLLYEVTNRTHARRNVPGLETNARAILERIELVELSPDVLARALAPYPVTVRTLDGLHLATMQYLLANKQPIRLASYDKRLIEAARAMNFEIEPGL